MSAIVRPRKFAAPAPEGKIDVEETCGILGISKTSLYRYMKEPGFPTASKQLGRTWFARSEIEAWKKANTPAPKDEGQGE